VALGVPCLAARNTAANVYLGELSPIEERPYLIPPGTIWRNKGSDDDNSGIDHGARHLTCSAQVFGSICLRITKIPAKSLAQDVPVQQVGLPTKLV
jgi:hypothetical protein